MSQQTRAPALLFCLLIVYVVWGSTYLGIRIGLTGFPPLILAAIRMTTAGCLLLAWFRLRGTAWPSARQWRNGVIIGTMMMSIGNGFVCLAEQSVSSGLAALLVASGPVFAIVFGWLFGTRPKLLEWLGVGLGIIGVGLLNLDATAAASPGGVILVVIAAATWSFATILQRRLDMPKGGMSAGVQMLGGGVVLFIMSQALGEHLPTHVPAASIGALLYLITFGSIVAYSAFVYVINHSRPALATSYAYVNPVVAVLLGAVFAGESISLPLMGGMAVILGGVALIVWAHARK
ncbi:drug/metabolite exporter YedA [Silvimonas iriomotensis]|uniref:Drug/metabolite exporter YedA n=1 Tax=Silvimonas iriomotensis TaxID=449662 RepID=A0ABQ2PEC5_9NEIS|nr:drug/metabolite exporter YedA [Silvimonas iriomotensis]GGP23741.1 drug/metabolite exporter YedA [Silvimonas iriomotensis]